MPIGQCANSTMDVRLFWYSLKSNPSLFTEKRLANVSFVNKLDGSTANSSNLEVFTVLLSEVLSELLVPSVVSSD